MTYLANPQNTTKTITSCTCYQGTYTCTHCVTNCAAKCVTFQVCVTPTGAKMSTK